MSIVGAIATVHAPFIAGMPELAPEAQRHAVDQGFDRLRSILDELSPDVIVTVSSEHITNFLSEDVPPFAVSMAEANPTQPEFGLPDRDVPGDSEFARGLVDFAGRQQFPLEGRDELYLDHGTNLPLKFLRPEYDVPVVPIIVNTIWAPFPSTSEAHDLGALLARYVEELWPETRVVIIGTGGISHWVGNRHHGQMNAEFDRWFIDILMARDDEALRSISDDDITPGGDGAHEIRTWITMSGAARAVGLVPEIVLEEPFVPGWNVGVYQLVWRQPVERREP
jgi:aromatic ring-opening dioxygenase catalytic subunit (LigB family)